MKRMPVSVFLAALFALFCACPSVLAESHVIIIADQPYDAASTEISFRDMTVDCDLLIDMLPQFPALINVDVCGSSLTDPEIDRLENAYPKIHFTRVYQVLGKDFESDLTEIDLSGLTIDDPYATVESLYRFDKLQTVFFGETAFSNEEMARLREEYKDYYYIVWTLTFGRWKLRTDCTAFSTSNNKSSVRYDETTFEVLKYCENLMGLDLGHNKIVSLDFLSHFPNLRLLILADNKVKDITPLRALTKLEYIELFMNRVSDLSPLANCKNLLDLNLNFNSVTDITPLYELNALERLWLYGNRFSKKQVNELRGLHPELLVDTTSKESTGNGWRRHDRYYVIRYCFQNRVYVSWTEDVPK